MDRLPVKELMYVKDLDMSRRTPPMIVVAQKRGVVCEALGLAAAPDGLAAHAFQLLPAIASR